MSDPKIPDAVLAALKGSGFPFQTAVAQVVLANQPTWRLHETEYPWERVPGDGRFLDLIATNGMLFLTIECKKTRKETFTFLRPLGQGNTGNVLDFRCMHAERLKGDQRVEISSEEWNLYPKTHCSQFCVVSTSDSGDQRLLEKDAGLLISATDAFADDFRRRATANAGQYVSDRCLFVPVIVTNAKLYTTRYKPSEAVPLDTGEFSKLPAETESVECIRFRKAFPSSGQPDLGDRSIFVVTASSFSTLLNDLQPEELNPIERRGQVQLRHRS